MKNKGKEQMYTVKDIIDIKTINKEEHCLVWWEGFPKNQATWEPTRTLSFLKYWKKYYNNLKQQFKHSENSENQSEFKQSNHNQKSTVKQHPTPAKTKNPKKQNIHEQQNQNQQIQSPHSPEEQLIHKKPKNKSKQSDKAPITKKIKKQKVLLRGKKIELMPVTVDLHIKQNQTLPFADKQLISINKAYVSQGQMIYEVVLQDNTHRDKVMMHNTYLKLLWPRQLADYLLGTIRFK